jgi:hypothetical protein
VFARAGLGAFAFARESLDFSRNIEFTEKIRHTEYVDDVVNAFMKGSHHEYPSRDDMHGTG